nr:flotillin family protein [uncultured Desulfuromonas sp.]
MDGLITIAGFALVCVLALIVIGMIFARLYKRASKELSFVRTGFGGQKIIMNGGALVLPVLHETIPVNMNTLRLAVHRANEQALITRDRMRVDVLAEFYVRVKPEAESIANAAQTLGLRTVQPEALKELVEGKFVDALRAVAAEMAMEELHEKRVDFVQKVQQVVSEDLLKNGLELESVSLTGLDQTSKEYFNPDNAFDAEGLTMLTDAIESRRKKRNDIEQDTKVAIQNKNLEAERQKLELSKEEEYARLQQEREIEIRRAAQAAEIAMERAAKKKEAEQADIQANQQIEQSRITSEKAIEEERIAKEKLVQSKDIEKARTIEAAEVEKRKTIELAEQDRAIAIAEKSKEQSVAQAEADKARSEAVKAEEHVVTVRETEIAERQKSIELVEARKQAEREAISITVAAEAKKQAADDYAEATRIQAKGDADMARLTAEGKSEAIKLEADAAAKRYAVDADGKKAINEADNILSAEQIAMQVKLALIEHLPAIIAESVKPMQNIDGIKIFQVEGINGAGSSGSVDGAGSQNQGSLADQVVNSALRYRAQAPMVEALLNEIGIDGSNINGMTQAFTASSSGGNQA